MQTENTPNDWNQNRAALLLFTIEEIDVLEHLGIKPHEAMQDVDRMKKTVDDWMIWTGEEQGQGERA